MSAAPQLRPALPEDREALYIIHRAAFRDLIVRTTGHLDEPQLRRHFDESFAPEIERVILLGERPVGSVQLDIQPGEQFVVKIMVHPDAQGGGIGAAVMRRCMDEARSAGDRSTLSVYRTNRARELYARLGYVPFATDGLRVWMGVPCPEVSPAERGMLLLRALDRRGSRHALRLRDGRPLEGWIETVEPTALRLWPAPGPLADPKADETLVIPVDAVDTGSLAY